MNEQDIELTLQEIEQLCRLYMDCGLSVFEETELQYVLTHVGYHSPLIDDVRGLMGIDAGKPLVVVDKLTDRRKPTFRKIRLYIGIAASIALIFVVGISIFRDHSISPETSQSYCIAYAGGERLSDTEARMKIDSDMQTADEFIRKMEELEEMEKQMMENFTNLNTFEK